MGARVRLLGASMVFAIVAVAALAFWDERREASAALDDFAREQTRIAAGVAAAMQSDSRAVVADSAEDNAAQLLERVPSLLRPGTLLVLVRPPGTRGLFREGGHLVPSEELDRALDSGQSWVRLSREDASRLGLPARTAMAGLSMFDAGPRGRGGVAVVATAQRERDRELRAQWRLVLSVVLASGLVLAFGGLALRKQRKELDLQRELAIAEVERERDAQLVRAEKFATMGALATGIAHEVSTPLGVIVGRAEQLLGRVDSDEKAKRAVTAILEQSERISRVIRGFLGLARGELPSLERVDPADVARNAKELVEHRFAKAGVRFSMDIAPDLPAVACEPRLFEQALINLLLNACDACQEGGAVDLFVRADAEKVAFVVLDNGTGIAPQAAARATEPFFTTKPVGQGTGLGLAIANEIVKHHQGSLTIEAIDSTPPHHGGTRACIQVPTSHQAGHA